MPHLARGILLTVSILFFVSCKVQVEPGIGGAVVSDSGEFVCYPGETCLVDVSDTSFDETFRAVASDGYAFEGWERRQGAFCGGRTDSCRLFTALLAGNEFFLNFLNDDELTYYLAPVFSYQGSAGEESTYFDVDANGAASGIATADGNILYTERTDEGLLATYMRTPDGSETYIEFGPDGLPRDLLLRGYLLRFRQFTDTSVIFELVDSAGNGVVGEIPFTDELATVVGRLVDNAGAVQSQAVSSSFAKASVGPASTVSAEATEDLANGVTAVELALEMFNSNSLRPLLGNVASSVVETAANSFAGHLASQGEQQTSTDLQLRVLAGAGVCYLSVSGGALIKLTGLPGCKEFVEASYAAVNSWAVEVSESRFKNTLDALAADAPLFGDELDQQIANQIVSADSFLGDYTHDIDIVAPKDNAFVQLSAPMTLTATVTDRVTEPPIDRATTLEVDYVYGVVKDKRYARFGRSSLLDETYSSNDDEPSISLVSASPGEVRTEGQLSFSVTDLPEGRNKVGIDANTLGVFSRKRVSVIATPYKPPFQVFWGLNVDGSGSRTDTVPTVGQSGTLTASLFDADNARIDDLDYTWEDSNGNVLSNSQVYERSFDEAGDLVLTARTEYYGVPFEAVANIEVAGDVTGTWRFISVVTSTSDDECDDGVDIATISVVQEGSTVRLVGLLEATINDRTIRWSNLLIPDGEGTSRSSASLTVSADYQSFTGTESWSYSESGFSCTGTSEIRGTRL